MEDYTAQDTMDTPEGMTLEDWGREQAAAAGFDPGLPQVQKRITEVAQQVRAVAPDKPDAEVIASAGPAITAALKDGGPGSLARVQEAVAKMQADFSPEKEAAVRKQVRGNKTWDAATQNLSLYGRMVATPQQAQVFQQMDAQQAERSNEPMENWQAKKKAAIAGIEQQIKMGEISRAEVQSQVVRLGLEQALEERKTRQALATAEADPQSATSEAMRQLAKKYAPEFVTQMGDRFNALTAAQLKGQLPALEKQYLKELEIGQKKLELEDKDKDRASRERVAGTSAAARVDAARIAAAARDRATNARGSGGSGSSGPVSTTPAEPGKISGLKRDKQGNISLSPDVQKALGPLAGAYQQATQGLQEIEDILPQIDKASASGLGSAVTSAQRYLGIETDQRKADEAIARFATAMLPAMDSPLMKGAPSEGDARRALATISDPQSTASQKKLAAAALKRALNDSVARYASSVEQYDAPTRQRLEATGIKMPPAAPTGGVRMRDRSGKIYNIPRDRLAEALADGLTEAK